METDITRINTGNEIHSELLATEFKDFVDDISCGICLNIVLDPICCGLCSALFCKRCISQWININKEKFNNKNSCPNGGEFQEQKLNIHTMKLLSKVKVRCSNVGCPVITNYENYFKHLDKECDFSMFSCNGCGIVNNKRVISMHVNVCDKMLELCNFCGFAFKRQDLSVHLKVCPEVKIKCDYCDKETKRDNLQQHLSVCEERIITCKYCQSKYIYKKENEHTKDVCFNDFKQRLNINNNKSNNDQIIANQQREIERLRASELNLNNKITDNCKKYIEENNILLKTIDTLKNENSNLKLKQNNFNTNNSSKNVNGFFNEFFGMNK